jgi:drug/metabolite transporter (DMT)-like permease
MSDPRTPPDHSSADDSRRSAYAVMLLQSLFASGTHLVAKVVVGAVDAFTLTLIRSLIAALAMVLLLFVRGDRLSIRREDYWLVLGLAFLAVPVNQFLFLFGMRYTTPSNAALLYATTPILVVLFSRWFLGEQLTRRKIAGVILGFIGVAVVILERGVDASMQYLFGNVILYVAVLAWGLYTVLGKRLIAIYGAVHASSITLIGGTLLFIPLGLLSAVRFPYGSLSAANWLEILYLGLITSVVSYLLWYFALARIEAGKVALFANLQPILTTIMAVVLLGQDITVPFLLGGTIAIAGVIVAQFG